MISPRFAKFELMCTLAIYFKAFADCPVVVAANRDEYLARPALPPTTLNEKPHVVGGKDLRASGTWLGINEHGLLAGLLNRRNGTTENDPKLRSRGLLCLDALRVSTAAEAARFVAAQNGRDYNPFNLLIASRDEAFVAYNRWGEIEVVTLTPGVHLLTNIDVDDFECPRISREWLEQERRSFWAGRWLLKRCKSRECVAKFLLEWVAGWDAIEEDVNLDLLSQLIGMRGPTQQADAALRLLRLSLKYSIQADIQYSDGFFSIVKPGCPLPPNANFTLARKSDALATAAKQRFVAVFNPLAKLVNRRQWSATEF